MLKALLIGTVGLFLLAAPVVASAAETDPAKAAAGSYKNDPRHTAVTLTFTHNGGLSHSTYRFDKVAISYAYDPARPEASPVTAVIDPLSIDTGVKLYDPNAPDFDKEVADKFLSAGKFPTITFKSTKIVRSGDLGTMTGDVTFLGVTKPVTLNVTYNGSSTSGRMGFSATTVIKRSDFGLTAMIGPTGDDIHLTIEVEFVKAA